MSISVLLFALLFSTLVIFLYYLFNMKLKGKVKNIKILGSEVNTKTLINYFVFVMYKRSSIYIISLLHRKIEGEILWEMVEISFL